MMGVEGGLGGQPAICVYVGSLLWGYRPRYHLMAGVDFSGLYFVVRAVFFLVVDLAT
jgi:hypothetical protein